MNKIISSFVTLGLVTTAAACGAGEDETLRHRFGDVTVEGTATEAGIVAVVTDARGDAQATLDWERGGQRAAFSVERDQVTYAVEVSPAMQLPAAVAYAAELWELSAELDPSQRACLGCEPWEPGDWKYPWEDNEYFCGIIFGC